MDSEKPLLLVVEDDPTQQRVICILAEKFGFLCVVVSTGQEALNAMLVTDSFDAILMDWKMPDMNGIECTRHIRAHEKINDTHTPIIAVTAHASSQDRQQCLDAGMDDYLSKPFSSEDFRRTLLRWTYKESRPNLKLLPSGYLSQSADG